MLAPSRTRWRSVPEPGWANWFQSLRGQFRAIVSNLRAHSPDKVHSFTGRFAPAESAGLSALEHYLRSLSALDRYFDDAREYITCVASPGMSVSVPTPLARASSKIVMSAIMNSVDVAADALHRFLEHDSFPMTLVYFLAGTRIAREIALDDQTRLIPADEASSRMDTSSTIFGRSAALGPEMAWCALLTEATVQPGTWGLSHHVDAGVDLRGVADVGIDVLSGLITLVSGRAFYPFASTHLVEQAIVDTLPITQHSPTGGWAVENHLVPFLSGGSVLPYLDTQGLRATVAGYRAADEEVRRRLHLPLSRFRTAKARLDHVDRSIDLAIAFRRMLTTRDESNIAQRLAERAAWLYAETEEQREWAEDRIRSFYRHQSDILRGEVVPEEADLYADAESIFVVCFRNIATRQSYPEWRSLDAAGTLESPTDDPAAILSAKHDTTSWTVGELEQIDDALSSHWGAVLDSLPPGSTGGTTHTHDVPAAVAELEGRGEAYVVADPHALRDAHPMWSESTERRDEARIWHCGEDITRHIRLWMEAARKKRLTVVIDSGSEFLRDHPL